MTQRREHPAITAFTLGYNPANGDGVFSEVGVVMLTSTDDGERSTAFTFDPDYVRMLTGWLRTQSREPLSILPAKFDLILAGWPEDWK